MNNGTLKKTNTKCQKSERKGSGLFVLTLALLLSIFISTSIPVGATPSAAASDPEYLKSMMDFIIDKYQGDVTEEMLVRNAVKGMFNGLDPYTTFYTPEEAESFLGGIEGNYEGIGVSMEKKGENIVIIKVFPSSPAEVAGLLSGDFIVEADGHDLTGASTEEAASLIKGVAGTQVMLGILRQGSNVIMKIEVTRAIIQISPVTFEIKDGIGYIKLEMFNSNADKLISEALAEFDKKGITKVVLDLRDNPGGEVSQAVAIARNFVPAGLVTKLDFKAEATVDLTFYSFLDKSKYKLAVLVNGNSASASEILAGAVQDTKAGVLIGTITFGKAKVQNLFPILTPEAWAKYEASIGKKIVNATDLAAYGVQPLESEIAGWTKITTGLYTTPNGRMIDNVGLVPDYQIENSGMANDIDVTKIINLSVTSKPTKGDAGLDVYNAEKILRAAGYNVDEPDTLLDSKTFAAIAAYQKASGLYSYGVLDFTTQKALNKTLEALLITTDLQYKKALELLSK
ncbi:MAG: S41 family peptidase [Clostridiales bacterium]|nr:S41 family peptidase [Clostridiales bacterium]